MLVEFVSLQDRVYSKNVKHKTKLDFFPVAQDILPATFEPFFILNWCVCSNLSNWMKTEANKKPNYSLFWEACNLICMWI